MSFSFPTQWTTNSQLLSQKNAAEKPIIHLILWTGARFTTTENLFPKLVLFNFTAFKAALFKIKLLIFTKTIGVGGFNSQILTHLLKDCTSEDSKASKKVFALKTQLLPSKTPLKTEFVPKVVDLMLISNPAYSRSLWSSFRGVWTRWVPSSTFDSKDAL